MKNLFHGMLLPSIEPGISSGNEGTIHINTCSALIKSSTTGVGFRNFLKFLIEKNRQYLKLISESF